MTANNRPSLSKKQVWQVGSAVFHTEAEADVYLDREDRISRAETVLGDLQRALTSDLATSTDPTLKERARSSSTALCASFNPEAVARALAFKPSVLKTLQSIFSEVG